MRGAAPVMQQHFLNKEESFMYDREASFPMEDTRNEARIEYTEKGMTQLSSRRCEILKLSRSGAVLSIATARRPSFGCRRIFT